MTFYKFLVNKGELSFRETYPQRELSAADCVFIIFLLILCEYVVIVDKDRELSEAQAEIKSLRLSERLREKAVEEVCCLFTM